MNKRILFVIGSFDIGGSRISLINLFNLTKQLDGVNLYCLPLKRAGELYNAVPKNVTVLKEFKTQNAFFSPKSAFDKVLYFFFHLCSKLFLNRAVYKYIYKKIARDVEKEYGCFDVAVGFQEGISNDCASFITAKKHCNWVHSNLEVWFNKKSFIRSVYDKSDRIFFVSSTTKDAFLNVFPMWSDKSDVIRNTIDNTQVLKKGFASSNFPYRKTALRIVTVGRLYKEKRIDRIVNACNMLKHNYDFQWLIIGDGPLFLNIQKSLKQYGLENNLYLVGATLNPYSYIKESDLLVVSSSTESQPMVILEALVLGTPVLSTNFRSAQEILGTNSYSLICDNSSEGLVLALNELMANNHTKILEMKKAINTFNYSNDKVLERIKTLVFDYE